MDQILNHEQKEKIIRVVDFYRGMILDAVEAEVGELSNWKYLRGRLLKLLGHSGLEGKIQEILDEVHSGVGHE